MRASNLHKPPPLLRLYPYHACIRPSQYSPNQRLNPSHTSIKPAQTSTTPVSESLSCLHQTCTNLTHSCVWILLIKSSNLHKPHPLLHLIPSHTRFKPAQTSPTLASESFSCLHQTCANLNHSCVWISLMLASNLHKPHPLLRLNPSHTSIKPAQTSPSPASQSLTCEHQTCTNLAHSCVWILLIQASNLRKIHSLLRLNPSHASIKPAKKNHSLLRLNPSHACIKPAQTSLTPASGTFSCEHQTCANLNHSCLWILLLQAFNLHKPQPLLHLIPSHTSIKPAQTSPTLASESNSCFHQTCANLTLSCVSILFIQASNLHKPHSFLLLNLPMRAKNLHKHHTRLRLNLYHACIKLAQTSSTPASESLSCVH